MSIVTKDTLKSYFETGDRPTQGQFVDLIDTLIPFKKYVALITQNGTDAPSLVVMENTIGAIVWSRETTGHYKATLAGAFPADKTWAIVSASNQASDAPLGIKLVRTSDDTVIILTYDFVPDLSDDQLADRQIEIRVYY